MQRCRADEVVTFVKAREAAQQAQQAHQDEEQQPQLSRWVGSIRPLHWQSVASNVLANLPQPLPGAQERKLAASTEVVQLAELPACSEALACTQGGRAGVQAQAHWLVAAWRECAGCPAQTGPNWQAAQTAAAGQCWSNAHTLGNALQPAAVPALLSAAGMHSVQSVQVRASMHSCASIIITVASVTNWLAAADSI